MQVVQERYFVRGCILTYVEKLDDEFTKMLQACDVHSTDFVIRLFDIRFDLIFPVTIIMYYHYYSVIVVIITTVMLIIIMMNVLIQAKR